jgi:hypothetical protein
MLALAALSLGPAGILEGVAGEGGEEGIGSRGRLVRRLIVTRLEVGSGGNCSEGALVGVDGAGGSASALVVVVVVDDSLRNSVGDDGICESSTGIPGCTVSTERLREPPREVR